MIFAALVDLPNSTALKIADYGAADGGTSQQMWGTVIRKLRDVGDMRQIEMIYTDLASNDFSTLFRMMQGMQWDPTYAYQMHFEDVCVQGRCTGFHKQLMTNES